MEKLKSRTKQESILRWSVIILIVIQPLIDMDYLIYDFLNQYGLPRFSTIIRFIIIPLLILWTFFLHDRNKKKTLILGGLYGVCLAVYFYFHCKQSAGLVDTLGFTSNFKFSTFQELTYVATLVIPFGLIYCFYHMHFDGNTLKKMICTVSGIISIPILVGDLFVFGKSTYYGNTVANIFSWFTDIYNNYHPRTLASKFYFNEGNTIGILLFMILPIMYYFFSKAETKKERRIIGTLIVVQSLSMQILATRIATYGAVLVPIIFLVLHFFDGFVMKHEKPGKRSILFCVICAAVFGALLPITPAVQNQKVDAKNDVALLDNGMADEGKQMLGEGEDLVPGTTEYNNFYINMFEVYGIKARYIQSVPSMYYVDYYNYKYDPKFWVDVTFMDVYDRVSGRQIETIFFNYKYQNLTQSQKILGMGYSTFMNGSIVLEQDFKQQVYTLGYAGELLCVCPWLLIALYGVVMILKHFKKMVNLELMCYASGLAFAFAAAYMSGHTLDQFMTTVMMALITAVLLNRVRDAKTAEKSLTR